MLIGRERESARIEQVLDAAPEAVGAARWWSRARRASVRVRYSPTRSSALGTCGSSGRWASSQRSTSPSRVCTSCSGRRSARWPRSPTPRPTHCEQPWRSPPTPALTDSRSTAARSACSPRSPTIDRSSASSTTRTGSMPNRPQPSFVARRLDADGIAMLFGVREPEAGLRGARHCRARRASTGPAASRHLLTSLLPAGTAPLVTRAAARRRPGKPARSRGTVRKAHARAARRRLALQEPHGSTPSVGRGFLRRLARLPTRTRRALGVAAASDSGDPGASRRSSSRSTSRSATFVRRGGGPP